MKNISFGLIFLLFAAFAISAQTAASAMADIVRIDAQPAKGFSYAYYLFIPKTLRENTDRDRVYRFLVIPNNTGKADDDIAFHDDHVKRQIERNSKLVADLGIAILSPVFPRPESDWKIYTHALDRDSLLTEKKEFARFDQQLTAMIDHARDSLKKEKIKIDSRVLMMGFSASGMFANRYAFIHPDRVKAAAIGSPGGWPIVPAAKFGGRTLRYPIGISDLEAVTGKPLDLNALRKVPMFLFLGDKDTNDSLVFSDGYDEEDKEAVFEVFGETPVERWESGKRLYKAAGLNAEFKLYPDVEHKISKEIFDDIITFLKKHK